MDDVWGNAWSQPEQDVAHNVPSKLKPLDDAPAWTASKHEEADVGLPSWSSGGLNWMEPTGQASLWANASAVDDISLPTHGWSASSSMDIGIGGGSGVKTEESVISSKPVSSNEGGSSDMPASEEERSRSSTPGSAGTVTSPTVHVEADSLGLGREEPVLPLGLPPTPDSTDPFGSFETGLSTLPLGSVSTAVAAESSYVGDAWSSPAPAFDSAEAVDDAWEPVWGSPTHPEEGESPRDEWALAQEEKIRRDRTVPPELLASIMSHLDELSSGLWTEQQKTKNLQEFGNWKDGMSSVDGLHELVSKVLPETAPQPPIQFPRSHTAKAMSNSIKLTKNLSIVRNSPMSHLFTARSSSAWELSVKSRVDLPKDDDIPAGWRTSEPEEKEEIKPALVEKRSSGFLSFWSKRASNTPSTATSSKGTDSKRSSLSREMTVSPVPSKLSGTGSARASVDAQSISDKVQQSPSLSSLSSGPPATTSSPSSSTLPSSLGSPTSVFPPSTEETPAIPTSPTAPSAVSRFLNRFSRTKSDVRPSTSDPRSSIALSTDDLEFLSDIVPSHSDGTEDNDGLNELTALTSSAAVPARLPPPLAPPPSPYPLRPVRLSRSQTPQPQPPATVSAAPKPSNVFGDFDELMPQPLASKPTSSGPFAPALPPLLPPPVSPTSVASSSKPSTPSLLPEINKHTSPVRTPPPISWSSSSSPSASFNIPPSGSGLEGLSQLSALTGSSSNSSAQVPLSSSPLSSPRTILPPRMQQPSESTSHLQFSFSPKSPTPPPLIEKSPNRVFVRSGPRPLDDDFSGFHGHSTSSMVLPLNQLQTSMSFDTSFGAQSDQSIMSHHSASQDDSFGDFGDFVTIDPSPAPIRVPASPPPMSRPKAIPPLPPPKKSVPPNISTTHIRKPSAADHHATALLVERAATHSGRWPAPPSPIPELLSPPPLSGKRAKQSESLLEIGQDNDIAPRTVTPTPSIALKSIAQITSATASRAPTPSLPRPTSPPVTNSDLSVHSLLDLSSPAQKTISPAPVRTLPPSQQMHSMLQPQPSSNQPTKGGLSAQDLSFFEGL